MRNFDRRFVDEAAGIVRALPLEKRPEWGSMSPPQMFSHMVTAIGYALGKALQTPNEGGLFGRLVAPILLNGWMRIPKGQKAPSMYDAAAPSATAEELVAALEAFHAKMADPAFAPPPHPFFGEIGKAGWAKLNIVHLEHHLRQFGVAPARFIHG